MSTAYYYNTELPLAPVFNKEPQMTTSLPAPGIFRSTAMKQQPQLWNPMDDPLTNTGSPDLAFLPPIQEALMLPTVDLHPLNFKKEYYQFTEPTSVLDMHLAASPGSSPSRSSVYGSPESSSARSVQSYSRQQSFSSYYSDSPQSSLSYPDDRRSPFSRASSFRSNVGLSSWVDCVPDPNEEEILDLSVLECQGSPAHSSEVQVQLDDTGNAQDLQFPAAGTMDLGGLESMMMLPEPDQEMLADPLGLLDEHEALSQLLNTNEPYKFERFQQHSDLRVVGFDAGSNLVGDHSVKQGGEFSGFQQQPDVVEASVPQEEETGLYLVQLLLGCAEAIDNGNYDLARSMLSQLSDMASPFGDSMQRIAVYFGDALTERIAKDVITDTTYIHTTAASSQPKTSDEMSLDSHVAYQAFYQVLPYVKFAHFTANQAILEAVGTDERIHVVDLDIGQGLQWPSLIQSLAMRESTKPFHLKITGVGADLVTLEQTGRRLYEFAASLQVPLEYHAVEERHLEKLDAGVLRVHLGESLAVNCGNVLNRFLGDEMVLEAILRMVNGLQPVVVALVEVECNDNLPFLSRFVEALHHYSALFDCIEATLGRSSTERLQIEKFHFASAIRDVMGGDASDQVGRHVRTESWQMYFRQAGFRDLALSDYALYQAKLLLGLYNGAYQLKGEGVALNLGWQETPIITVSAWTC